ncbi:MAG: DUF2332 domain-containing protein [Ilumatobacteraceae bacterium]
MARCYPSVVADPDPPSEIARRLGPFLRAHDDELMATVRTRAVQTNEVGRAPAIALAMNEIGRRTGAEPSLLEVGCSAGLLLALDRYRIVGGASAIGPSESPVRITPEWRGSPPRLDELAIHRRVGLDLEPIDVTDPIERRWLEACIWPDDAERRSRLRAAVEVRLDPATPNISLRRGDALDGLAAAVASIPADRPLVVAHSWVLAYLTPARRRAWFSKLGELGGEREIWWLGIEQRDSVPELPAPLATLHHTPATELSIARARPAPWDVERLASLHPHGTWIATDARRQR